MRRNLSRQRASTTFRAGRDIARSAHAQPPPAKDGKKAGRDPNKNAFCCWLAGGGVKSGTTYGSTDELGLAAVENRVAVPDWQGTRLQLLGLRHDESLVEEHGLEEKLTGVSEARIAKEILT